MGRRPRPDATLGDRQIIVRHDQFGVDFVGGAETIACLTRAIRRVEGEVTGSEFVIAGATQRASQMLTEREHLRCFLALLRHQLHLGHAVGQLEGRLQGIGQTTLDIVPLHETIDHDVNGVILVARQLLGALQELGDINRLAVDTRSYVTLGR